MLRKRARTYAKLVTDLHRLRQSALPATLKAEVARALKRLDSPLAGKLPNPIEIMGLRIAYTQASLLRYLFHEIFVDGSYLFQSGRPYPRILDCGSNIGLSVLFFKKLYPQSRITAFEPDPATFAMLKRNIEGNRLTGVTPYAYALSDKDGTIEFHRAAGVDAVLTMSTRAERMSGETIPVPARRLSPFIGDEEVDLLKLDVEGAEDSILPELASSGALKRIREMHIEYHHHIDPKADRFAAFLKLIEDNGFGYQLAGKPESAASRQSYQDVAIHAYRK